MRINLEKPALFPPKHTTKNPFLFLDRNFSTSPFFRIVPLPKHAEKSYGFFLGGSCSGSLCLSDGLSVHGGCQAAPLRFSLSGSSSLRAASEEDQLVWAGDAL